MHQTTQAFEGGSARAEYTEAVTGENADMQAEHMHVVPVSVVDPIRTEPDPPRHFTVTQLQTADLLAKSTAGSSTRIASDVPTRTRLVLSAGTILTIGPTEGTATQTSGFKIPANTPFAITAKGEVWASVSAGGFTVSVYQEFTD